MRKLDINAGFKKKGIFVVHGQHLITPNHAEIYIKDEVERSKKRERESTRTCVNVYVCVCAHACAYLCTYVVTAVEQLERFLFISYSRTGQIAD